MSEAERGEEAGEVPIYTSARTSVYIEGNDILSVLLRTHRDIDMYIGGLCRSLCSRPSKCAVLARTCTPATTTATAIVQVSCSPLPRPRLYLSHLPILSAT